MSRAELRSLLNDAFSRDEIIAAEMNNYEKESMFYGTQFENDFNSFFGVEHGKGIDKES